MSDSADDLFVTRLKEELEKAKAEGGDYWTYAPPLFPMNDEYWGKAGVNDPSLRLPEESVSEWLERLQKENPTQQAEQGPTVSIQRPTAFDAAAQALSLQVQQNLAAAGTVVPVAQVEKVVKEMAEPEKKSTLPWIAGIAAVAALVMKGRG